MNIKESEQKLNNLDKPGSEGECKLKGGCPLSVQEEIEMQQAKTQSSPNNTNAASPVRTNPASPVRISPTSPTSSKGGKSGNGSPSSPLSPTAGPVRETAILGSDSDSNGAVKETAILDSECDSIEEVRETAILDDNISEDNLSSKLPSRKPSFKKDIDGLNLPSSQSKMDGIYNQLGDVKETAILDSEEEEEEDEDVFLDSEEGPGEYAKKQHCVDYLKGPVSKFWNLVIIPDFWAVLVFHSSKICEKLFVKTSGGIEYHRTFFPQKFPK